VLVTFAAIMISTYVTTSTYILSQDQKAVADFRNIAQRVEDLQVSVIQTSSEDRLLLYDYVKCDRLLPASSASIRQSPQVVPVDLSADASKDRPDRQAVMQTREEQILVVKLAGACRQQQRAQMKLLTEGGRLRSWDSVLIQHPVLAWVSNSLLGWSDGTMKEIGALMSGGSCQGIATTLGMVEEAPDGASPDRKKNCGEILRYLVKDSPSMASSILGSLTLYVLPCLYGYLSAVAATLFDLRSKISASLLSFTDRGQSIHDQIMGILFGAVIGLFADQLSGVGSSHGLAVSALALLAGFMSRAWWRS
jgi:tetrahydromethanopterin S-methyltransferase subunit G